MDYTTWFASLRGSIAESVDRIGAHLPSILGGIALVLFGWIAAWLIRLISVRVVTRLARLVPGATLKKEMRDSGVEKLAPRMVGGFVFWVVLLLFCAAAAEVVGLTVVTTGVNQLARYLPQILAAVLVVLIGLVLANLARRAVVSATQSAGIAQGELIGQALRVAILLVAGIVALDQVGIDSRILDILILIAAGTLFGGTALAFGLGARSSVSDLLAVHYTSQNYRPGQTVRLGDLQGRIVEFSGTGVVLETEEGRVMVPGSDFSRSRSLLVEGRR